MFGRGRERERSKVPKRACSNARQEELTKREKEGATEEQNVQVEEGEMKAAPR